MGFGRMCWNISEFDNRHLSEDSCDRIFHSHAAVAVGKALFPLFALALDLPEDFFDDKVSRSPSTHFISC